MCSASRDRLIHVFTAGEEYQHVQTIDDHSASITALRFTGNQLLSFLLTPLTLSPQSVPLSPLINLSSCIYTVRGGLQLLSCGADKSIMFRTLQKVREVTSLEVAHRVLVRSPFTQSPGPEFQRTSHIACKASIYDMDIDVVGKHMVTAGQDRLLRSAPCVMVIPPQARITSLSLSIPVCACVSSLCFIQSLPATFRQTEGCNQSLNRRRRLSNKSQSAISDGNLSGVCCGCRLPWTLQDSMWPAVALIRLCLSLISTLENVSQNSTATQVPSLLFFLYSLAHSFLSSPSLRGGDTGKVQH